MFESHDKTRLRLHRDAVEHVSSVEFADTANIKVKVTVDAETAEIEIIEVMNDMNDEMVTLPPCGAATEDRETAKFELIYTETEIH